MEKDILNISRNKVNLSSIDFIYDYLITDIELSDHTAKCEVPGGHFSKDLEIQYDQDEQHYYVVVDFTAEETYKMPLGVGEIIVVVYNHEGKQQSLKRILVKVLKRGTILPENINTTLQELVANPGYLITQAITTPPYDHDALRHRDFADQHPISAITDLESTLQGKQAVIEDLEDIRAGAAKGATAVQPDALGDATLTIQKNSTTVGTFTANAKTDKNINITVPTTAADVNALPDSTKYGANLSVSVDPTTYVMTVQLKDQEGDNLGSAQTVDLPLESVVVSGS